MDVRRWAFWLLIVGIVLLIAGIVVAALTFDPLVLKEELESQGVVLGEHFFGGVDEHGCLPNAGYEWCEEKQRCLKSRFESCS